MRVSVLLSQKHLSLGLAFRCARGAKSTVGIARSHCLEMAFDTMMLLPRWQPSRLLQSRPLRLAPVEPSLARCTCTSPRSGMHDVPVRNNHPRARQLNPHFLEAARLHVEIVPFRSVTYYKHQLEKMCPHMSISRTRFSMVDVPIQNPFHR